MDPVQQSIAAWHKAFFTALHQSQTERLKKKIESQEQTPTLDFGDRERPSHA